MLTQQRTVLFEKHGLHFVGMGVSGGEEGADTTSFPTPRNADTIQGTVQCQLLNATVIPVP